MNLSDIIIYLFLFGVGGFCGIIASILAESLNHFVVNQILSESIFRNLLSLFLILLFSFIGSMIGFVGFVGFATDENAGEIFPYYLTISGIVSLLCTVGYYYLRMRQI